MGCQGAEWQEGLPQISGISDTASIAGGDHELGAWRANVPLRPLTFRARRCCKTSGPASVSAILAFKVIGWRYL